MTTSVIRAGGTGVAGIQTTGGDDGALAVKVGPLAATVEALSITTAGNVGIGANLTAGDNKKILFGTDSDAEIYHDGGNMYFKNDTGNTLAYSDTFQFFSHTGSELFAQLNHNSAVKLYFDSALKFETTAAGADVVNSVNDVKLKITTTGTNKAANLELHNTVAGYNFISNNTNGAADWRIGGGAAAGTLTFQTGSANEERMRIDATGGAAIGTTISSNARLTVDQGTRAYTLDLVGQDSSDVASIRFINNAYSASRAELTAVAAGGLITSVNGSEKMRIDSGGLAGIGMNPVANYGKLQVGSAVTSALGVGGLQAYVSGTDSALGQNGNMSIVTTNGQAANLGGSIGLGGKFVAAGTSAIFAHIAGRKENGTDNNSAGYLQLATQPHGGTPTERMRITSTGNMLLGGQVSIGHTGGPGGQLSILFNRAYNGIHMKETSGAGGGSGSYMLFQNSAGATQGSITCDGSGNTGFNASSDYRLKENVEYNWDATTELRKLKPAKFNFIVNPSKTVEGFLAHEVEDIVPAAITGTKDAVEEDGSIKPQQIDQSKLVPLLVKTILELEARITVLEG